MDYTDKEILDLVGYVVVFGAIWVVYKSPLLSWICKVIGKHHPLNARCLKKRCNHNVYKCLR